MEGQKGGVKSDLKFLFKKIFYKLATMGNQAFGAVPVTIFIPRAVRGINFTPPKFFMLLIPQSVIKKRTSAEETV